MRARKYILIFISMFLFSLVSGLYSQTETIKIGSLNLEWFGSRNKIRFQYEIEILANYIKSLEMDLICFQEVNPQNDATGNGNNDWIDFLGYLGSAYNSAVGKSGSSQKIAMVWNKNKVELFDIGELVNITPELVPGTGKKTFSRIPFTAYVKSLNGELDFRLIVVHLNWSGDEVRYAEAKALNEWYLAYTNGANEKDVLIIGDFNTKSMDGTNVNPSNSKTITNLEFQSGLICISKNHHEFTTPLSRERYDHAFLSESLYSDKYYKNSWVVCREEVILFLNNI